MASVVEDDGDVQIVSIGKQRVATVDVEDSFQVSPEQVRKMDGLGPALKKRITQKFLRGTGSESKQVELETMSGYDVFQVASPGYNLSYLSKLYELSSFHHAAVDAKVSNTVGLGYDLVESPAVKQKLSTISDEKKLERTRVKLDTQKQALIAVIDDLNEDSLFVETLMKAVTDLEATGNGYIEIGRTTNGRIGYIGHIPSVYMRVRLNRDGFIQIISNKATYFRNFGDQKTPDPLGKDKRPNEVIHIKKYTPTSTYYGVPDIVSAKTAVAGNEFSGRFNLEYFENKAVPRYIISLKGAKLNEENERRLLEFFETNLKGQNHRSLYIPLPADDPNRKVELKLDAVENGVQDSSFDSYHNLNRDEILMAHRVPISKIGIPDGVSLAIAKDADKTFKEQVCGPIQRNLEKKLNPIVKEFTDTHAIKLNELTLTDEDTQSRIDERYLRMQTILPNEVRARKGMPGIDSGDSVVDLKPQQAANQRQTANQNDARSQERQANATDEPGNARQPKGEGRATP